MFLTSFSFGGKDRLGARVGDTHVVDLHELADAAGGRWSLGPIPATMETLIEKGPDFTEALSRLVADRSLVVNPIPIDQIDWHPPVRRPGKIVCVALNNSASDDRKISAPEHPLFFMKPRTCLLGHLRTLEMRSYYRGVHPEPELAVVIGKTARDLEPRSAMDAVYGYSIFNDLTGNDMRGEDMVHYYALYASKDDPTQLEKREQHLSYPARYKGTDGFGPMGPWLVTRDEVPDPNALDVVCTVGGEVVAQDSTRYLTYSVAEVLAFLSRFQTLEPGDVVSMGTAFRKQDGAKRSLHTANLQVVDGPMDVAISGLGTLRTLVSRSTAPLQEWRNAKAASQPVGAET